MTIQETLRDNPALASAERCFRCAKPIGDEAYDVNIDGCVYHDECPSRHTYLVAVYLEDRAFGGPEEGGWWYDTGELVRVTKSFASKDRARQYASRLNRRLQSRAFGPNLGRREIGSVLSEGEYCARVERDTAPSHYPERRPRYE